MFKKITAVILFAIISVLVFPAACNNPEFVEKDSSMVKRAEIPPIDILVPTVTETATFALGWFWGPDSRFGSIDGVACTRVGYSGGTTDSPDYNKLGDHTETVQIDYDPTVISYEELLDVFWDSHAPTVRSWSRQYMSIIFYHNEEQKRLAVESKHREEARLGQNIFTEIVPASEFYLAEVYHQKYYLTHVRELMKELTTIYPETEDFVASTAVARLNGYAGGYGTPDTLKEQLNSFGLSEKGKEKLQEIAEQGLIPGCAVR